ncbi:MAG: TIGR02611 family protein [Kineosporiaceae bacterium]
MPVEPSSERQHSTPDATSGKVESARPSSGRQRLPGPPRSVRAARNKLKSHPVTGPAYKVTVGVVGALVVLLGLLLVPFPGPGWLIVILGLLILASEFTWAKRLLDFVQDKVRAWTEWMKRRSVVVRVLVGLLTVAFVAAVLYAMALLVGVPSWVPGRIVPPLPGLEEYSDWF